MPTKGSFYKLMLISNINEDTNVDKYLSFVGKCCEFGVTSVQLRAEFQPIEIVVDWAWKFKNICKQYDVPLIINDSLDVFKMVNADGIHLGKSDTSVLLTRLQIGANKIIGVSVSSIKELKYANSLPINYVATSTIFKTENRADMLPLGLGILKEFSSIATYPNVAIGGINLDNVASIWEHRADGIAVVGALHNSKDLQQDIKLLLKGGKNDRAS